MFTRKPETIGEAFLGGMAQIIGTMYHMGVDTDVREDWQIRALSIAKRVAEAYGADVNGSVADRAELLVQEISKDPCGDGGQHSVMPTTEAVQHLQHGASVILSAIHFGVNEYDEKSDLTMRTATLIMEMASSLGSLPESAVTVEDGAAQIYALYMEGEEPEDDILDADVIVYGTPDKF